MLIKFPWLKTRRVVFLSFLIDSIGLLSLFYVYLRIVKIPKSFTFPYSFLLIWLVFSYILGRYSKNNNMIFDKVNLFKQTIITLFISFSIYYMNLNFILDKQYNLSNKLKILIFIILFSILSYSLQSVKYTFIKKTTKKGYKWLFIGNKENFDLLNENLYISRIKGSLFREENIEVFNKDYLNDFTGIIIDKFDKSTHSEIIKYKPKLKFYTSLSWCYEILQRIPNKLIHEGNIYNFLEKTNHISMQFFFKRLGDIIFSILLLILSLPLLIIAMLIIKLEDNGSIFYKQLRTGKDEKQITILKLRTMKENAEEGGARWSSKNDQRITKIGSFLRSTRLDELPQLWSVIKGDMSLIGPRPERPEFDSLLKKEIVNYTLRYRFIPGLSGWAQVNYPYGASIEDSKNKLSYDLFYIAKYSLALDFLILFKTIKLVINGQGAEPK